MRPRRTASRPLRPPAPPLAGRRAAGPGSQRPKGFAHALAGLGGSGRPEGRERLRRRRYFSLALAALELAGLVALFVAPAFRVSRLDVSGNQRLTEAQVIAAAGLQRPGTVFQVDPGRLERRLTSATWVRAASVSAQLPDRVSIHVRSGSQQPSTGREAARPGTCRRRRWRWARPATTPRRCSASTALLSPSRGAVVRCWSDRC